MLVQRTVGIVGNGFIGKAAQQLACRDVRVLAFDVNPDLCEPRGLTLKELCEEADVVWVSVPTPMNPKDGSAHLGVVEKAVRQCMGAGAKHIVLRSTVPPGTSRRLGVAFMPEFLTEARPADDFRECSTWFVGFDPGSSVFAEPGGLMHPGTMEAALRTKDVLETAHRAGRLTSSSFKVILHDTATAEMIKYARNTFLALKVAFANEMADVCKKIGVFWHMVADAMGDDKRIGPSHLAVPGPDGKRGFGGTCFPKDVCALRARALDLGARTPLLDAAWARNVMIDRPERDWEADKGRAVAEEDA